MDVNVFECRSLVAIAQRAMRRYRLGDGRVPILGSEECLDGECDGLDGSATAP